MLERYKESYKSITVGDELKGRILFQAKENFQRKSRERIVVARKTAVAIAACLAIVFGVGVSIGASGFQKTQVFYNGDMIRRREACVTEASARSYNAACQLEANSGVPLEIKTDVGAKVSVSDGEILVYDSNYDNLVFIGNDYITDRSVLLFWNLSEATEKDPVLTVENDYEMSKYSLNESEGGYVIRLTAKEKK